MKSLFQFDINSAPLFSMINIKLDTSQKYPLLQNGISKITIQPQKEAFDHWCEVYSQDNRNKNHYTRYMHQQEHEYMKNSNNFMDDGNETLVGKIISYVL